MGYKEDRIKAQEKLTAKQAILHKVFEEADTGTEKDRYDFMKSTTLDGKTIDERIDNVRKMNKELEALNSDVMKLVDLENAEKASKGATYTDPINSPIKKVEQEQEKGLGDFLVEQKVFKDYKNGTSPSMLMDVDLKTLMETSAGWAPQAIRTGTVVPFATRPIQVIDVVPMGNTSQNAIVYMEETTFTNNAAEVAEGNTYGEAALSLTQRSVTVIKIGVWLPITDEQLEDIPQVQSYVNNRLTFMLRQRLDGQILVGNGASPNLQGVLTNTGIQSIAKAGDIFDETYKIKKNVQVVGQAIPNLYIMHPDNWQTIRLQRSTEGIYILGNPSEVGTPRLWGLPVVEAQAETVGTIMCGDFANHLQLVQKRGIELNITDSHADYFINGKKAIRADMRLALVNYRPQAFCALTEV